jgi:N4-(beta-N-acetylglucosaminyl)-L-asparaginase
MLQASKVCLGAEFPFGNFLKPKLVLLTVSGKLLAVSTWNFGNATAKAWDTLKAGGTAIDAVEKGVHN